jgi:hypothetical protein
MPRKQDYSDTAEAFAVARGFSATKPELGPYCVVEVWPEGTGGA